MSMKGVLVNIVVSSNPKDWKVPAVVEGYEQIEGNDTAGYVEEVGDGVQGFKVGDRVAGFTRTRDPRGGVYAEFSVAPSSTTFRLSPNTSFEDAAAIPLPFATAADGLFNALGVPLSGFPPEQRKGVLLYGAGTTVGCYAIQLAKRLNLYVVGVAGGTSDYVKALGCDKVLDYRKKQPAELAAEIATIASKRDLSLVYDAVSEDGSLEIIAQAYRGIKGVQYGYVLSPTCDIPPNFTSKRISAGALHSEEHREFGAEIFRRLSQWLAADEFKAHRTRLVPHGLAGVGEALRLLQERKVSGEKLILRIADTPEET